LGKIYRKGKAVVWGRSGKNVKKKSAQNKRDKERRTIKLEVNASVPLGKNPGKENKRDFTGGGSEKLTEHTATL